MMETFLCSILEDPDCPAQVSYWQIQIDARRTVRCFHSQSQNQSLWIVHGNERTANVATGAPMTMCTHGHPWPHRAPYTALIAVSGQSSRATPCIACCRKSSLDTTGTWTIVVKPKCGCGYSWCISQNQAKTTAFSYNRDPGTPKQLLQIEPASAEGVQPAFRTGWESNSWIVESMHQPCRHLIPANLTSSSSPLTTRQWLRTSANSLVFDGKNRE